MAGSRIEALLDSLAAVSADVVEPTSVHGGDDELGRLEAALQRFVASYRTRIKEEATLLEITLRMNMGFSLDEVMGHLFEALRLVLPYDRIGLALLEPDGTVSARWVRSDAPSVRLGPGYRAQLEGSSLERIVTTGQPRILNDLQAHAREHPRSEATRRLIDEGMRSSLTCPLVVTGKPVGFIFFSSMQPETYAKAHVDCFRRIAAQVSLAVEKAKLAGEIREASDFKSRLLGMVAHDLRNPAAVVQMYLRLFLGGELGALTADQFEVLGELDHANDRMLRLLAGILDMRTIEAGRLELHLEKVEVESHLRGCLSACRPAARARSIRLEVEAEPSLPPTLIDPQRIEQVVYNLVSNAIKFSRPGTAVTVSARRDGGAIAVDVSDEGPGLNPEDIPRLFTEFGKGTRNESSTGLGLAIARSMVQQHGGRIGASNRPGGGATFTFTIPRCEAGSEDSG